MEYTPRIDGLIEEQLRSRNRVAPEHLPGIPDEEGAAFLAHYAQVHGTDGSIVWDGARLSKVPRPAQVASDAPPVDTPETGPGPDRSASAGPGAKPSPVDEILAAPVGETLLDTKPAGGAVSGWLWLLPLVFLLPGGLIAWWLSRGTNRVVARLMLATGIVMTVITVASGMALRDAMDMMRQGFAQ